jgi:hypothetical protein
MDGRLLNRAVAKGVNLAWKDEAGDGTLVLKPSLIGGLGGGGDCEKNEEDEGRQADLSNPRSQKRDLRHPG